MIKGDVIFCATGVTNGDLAIGVRDLGNEYEVNTFVLHKSRNIIKNITNNKLPHPRVATLTKFNKNGSKELIDEGVIIWFPAPNSYTGEDLAEFHVHGSRAVIKAMHLTISKIKGCRLAQPGEFTKRAFQNGRINLLKAESIADLISSETEIQRKQALKIMSGKSSDKYNSWMYKVK